MCYTIIFAINRPGDTEDELERKAQGAISLLRQLNFYWERVEGYFEGASEIGYAVPLDGTVIWKREHVFALAEAFAQDSVLIVEGDPRQEGARAFVVNLWSAEVELEGVWAAVNEGDALGGACEAYTKFIRPGEPHARFTIAQPS